MRELFKELFKATLKYAINSKDYFGKSLVQYNLDFHRLLACLLVLPRVDFKNISPGGAVTHNLPSLTLPPEHMVVLGKQELM